MLEHLEKHAIKADALFFVPAFVLYAGGMGLVAWTAEHREGTAHQPSTRAFPGFMMVALGLACVFAGFLTLRRNDSSTLVIRKGHRLITHGIDGVIRHPIYLGALLVSLGFPILADAWIALPPMLLLIPLVFYRIRIEEDLLRQKFGQAYDEYRARTKKLLPFLL